MKNIFHVLIVAKVTLALIATVAHHGCHSQRGTKAKASVPEATLDRLNGELDRVEALLDSIQARPSPDQRRQLQESLGRIEEEVRRTRAAAADGSGLQVKQLNAVTKRLKALTTKAASVPRD